MSQRKRELSCKLPATTELKLFEYPHKYGGKSWCVGFERHTTRAPDPVNGFGGGEFVSQTFLTEWSEDYQYHLIRYKSWKQAIGAE